MADIIFYGGHILPMTGKSSEAEALAIKDGKILGTGHRDKVEEKWRGAKTKVVELKNKTLMPGLIEPHTHPVLTALTSHSWTDVSSITHSSRGSIVETLHNVARRTPPGDWVLGFGWDPVGIDGMTALSMEELDGISSQHPVLILFQIGHACFANSVALREAKITDKTPGMFVRDDSGKFTGYVKEGEATTRMFNAINYPAADNWEKMLETQMRGYARHGYTTITGTGISNIGKDLSKALAALDQVGKSPSCPVNIILYHFLRQMKGKPPHPQVPGSSNPCHIGVKFIVDGSPYAATMAVREPYLETELTLKRITMDSCPCFGHIIYPHELLLDRMRLFHRNGWQLAAHSHGERAIDQVLDIYETICREFPGNNDARHRLEHCGLVTLSQMERAKRLGVTLSFFPDHIYYWGDALEHDILGPERARRFMPLRSARDLGLRWTVHSDSPCTPLGPFRVMQTCVTRTSRTGRVIGEQETVNIDDVLKAYTCEAAWQTRHEEFIGTLEEGKMADLVIMSDNPRTVLSEQLHNIKVVQTYRAGRLVNFDASQL